jgi:hypothetical protein
MYNKEILDELVRQFGEEKTILFCKMESVKNKMLYESTEEDRKHHPEPNEWAYERDWWSDNGKELEETRFAKRQVKINPL